MGDAREGRRVHYRYLATPVGVFELVMLSLLSGSRVRVSVP